MLQIINSINIICVAVNDLRYEQNTNNKLKSKYQKRNQMCIN